MTSYPHEGEANVFNGEPITVRLPTDTQAMISEFMKTLSYAPIPSRLLLPASSFRSDIEAILKQHLTTPPTGELLAQVKRESALWSNPNLIFLDCRADQKRFETWAYNKSLGTLQLLRDGSPEQEDSDVSDDVKTLPIYRILSLGFRKGMDESQVSLQSRSTSLTVWYDERKEFDWYEKGKSVEKEGALTTTNLAGWLGSDIINLAQTSAATGSWVPYVRNLLGVTDLEPPHPQSPITPIRLPLSSLLVLFLKCSNTETTSFVSVDSAGNWQLPTIDGNQGKDTHLFYNATDDVIVTVV